MIHPAGASRVLGLAAILGLGMSPQDPSPDWPMWRHDAGHTAATPRPLPERLHLQWSRELPPLRPGWPDQPRMQLDAEYEPVVLGQTMFVPSSRADSLTAYDTRSGREKWTFFTDGPVRYPAAAWEGRVYFTSDDGHLYCLDAGKGALLWKFFGGPRDRRILGNERLISTWPARGAPVIADGTVYYAAGIWPFMGTFLHALDARTGNVVWSNEADGCTYMQQPHNTDAFAGVAPQGPLAVSGDRLLVPGGRSVPACYDRRTGKLLHFEFAKNARRGGVDVSVAGNYAYVGGSACDLATGLWAGDLGRAIVATPETVWYAGKTKDLLVAKPPVGTTIETLDRKGNKTVKPLWKLSPPETIEAPRPECLIKAGERIYLGAPGLVLAYEKKKEVWRAEIPGTPASLLAGDDRLFVVTREEGIHCFGAEKSEPAHHRWISPVTLKVVDPRVPRFGKEGYAVHFGPTTDDLLAALLRQTRLHVIAFDPDAGRVAALRREFADAGLYGDRLAIHQGDPSSIPLPPYFAGAIQLSDPPSAEILAKLYASLRPFGGRLLLPMPSERRGHLERLVADAGLLGAEIREDGGLVVVREGALPGSADWTHEHADAANTRVSKDRIVRAPLGILWFGGPSHEGILPRHGHGPQPQVIDGRLLIEGVDKLRALDIYTGRILWEASLPGVGEHFNNVAHQPGANASGTNFISTSDGIYVAYKDRCLRLDSATGKTISEFPVPGRPTPWGYLNVVGDYLVGGADPVMDVVAQRMKEGGFDDPLAPLEPLVKKVLSPKVENDTLSASRRLFVMDRRTGRVLWEQKARAAFRHNAICAGGGRLYAIDRLSGAQVDRMKKKGETPNTPPLLLAFDLKDGRELWRTEEEVFGTWLSVSEEHGILVEAGRVARDTLKDETKGMRARRASDGATLWKKNLLGPAMIHGETILMADRACDLRTGNPKGRLHPMTLQPVEWSYARTYGCNTPMASEHLLTFRSGAAGFFDLASDGGTGNFGGFRSSCTNNLICAGGILSAPDYTRTCTCSYQNQASLALVPMPEAEQWTFFGTTDVKAPVRRVGINFGAPGDRRAEDGTLWVEFPGVGGKSPAAPVSLSPDKPLLFRKNALRISGEGPAWVAASGAKGLKEVTVALDKDAKEERLYTVRLHFVEPDGLPPGGRVFDVSIQGKPVLKEFDVAREAGGPDRSLVREFREVGAKKELKIAFAPRAGVPVLCGIEILPSCRLPLFRFALERWAADPYQIVVPRGSAAVETAGANARVDRGGSSRVEVAYPGGGPVLWSGSSGFDRLLDSPVRREILHRLLAGESAVWVLLECGDKAKDDAAAALLEATLKDLEGTLALPELRPVPEDALANATVPLRLDFSVLRLARDNPAEEILARMLLRSARGLEEKPEPLVFPVFGRGRSLPGFGLAAEGIRQAAASLVAPCTREAKGPGFDLLMKADWTGLVGEPPGKVIEVPAEAALQVPRPEEEYVAAGDFDVSSPRYQLGWILATVAAMLLLFLLIRSRRAA